MLLYTKCKFCDGYIYFNVPKQPTRMMVAVAFKDAMDAHLLEHVEEMTEIPWHEAPSR